LDSKAGVLSYTLERSILVKVKIIPLLILLSLRLFSAEGTVVQVDLRTRDPITGVAIQTRQAIDSARIGVVVMDSNPPAGLTRARRPVTLHQQSRT
jgi:hypothetical protein